MQEIAKERQLVPIITSAAGSCLTSANWQQAGIKTVAVYLDALLVKPGLSLLQTLPSLNHYIAWPGTIVLNATLLAINNQGLYHLRSSYDGSHISIDELTLFALVQHLKPNYVILPEESSKHYEELWQHLPSTIIPLFATNSCLMPLKSLNYYQHFSSALIFEGSTQAITPYLLGDLKIEQFATLPIISGLLLESNQPAQDALEGKIYSVDGLFNLLEELFQQQFIPLSADCACSTCQQNFTRAYLHHLLQHTPLLCQRLLIQHNVHYCYRHLLN